jgi:hypothetical protein
LAALETMGGGEETDMTFLEGVLQSLERDLGEALVDRRGVASAEERGVLLSFAQEHFAMQSASSLSRCRATYASREQIQLRLKFLQSSAACGALGDTKAMVPVQAPGLSEEEAACRRVADEHVCFVTLGGWRECVMGLGLFVHPRTLRERRRNLPPEVDLVVDYVSAEAYNLGVRSAVQHAEEEGAAGSDDEDDEEGVDGGDGGGRREAAAPRTDVLTSSARKRINAWLPLYINEAHWQTAGTFAPSAFSLIATQLNAAFKPSDALKVCSRLLCCVVVGFVHPTKEQKDRAKASEAAVQMYCDVHRLFHKMAEIYPEIRETALREVQTFIADPEKRTRRGTPNLGDLVSYLSIIDEVNWPDLAPVFVPEMVRRAATRFREPFDALRCEGTDGLIARFDELEPEHGLVILFNKVFNAEVARPAQPWEAESGAASGDAAAVALPCAKVCAMYDRRWGQLPSTRRSALLKELERIRGSGSVAKVLRELLPFAISDEDIGELLLWADKNAANKKAIHALPNLRPGRMPRDLTTEWRRQVGLRTEMTREVTQFLASGASPSAGLGCLLRKAAELEARLAADAGAEKQQKHRFASREEACEVAASERRRAEEKWDEMVATSAEMEELYSRSALGYKGKMPKGKGKGGGTDSCAKGKGGKGKGGACDARPQGSTPSDWWEERQLRDFVAEHTSPFDLHIVVASPVDGDGTSEVMVMDTLRDVRYARYDGLPATVGDLRERLGAHLGQDARKMRLVLRGFGPLCVSKALAKYRLHVEDAILEVQEKQRGGKRKPGCGWFRNPPNKLAFEAGIAGVIARETTFAGVAQYHTRVDDGCRVQTLLGLLELLGQDAVVVCSSGPSKKALLQLLRQCHVEVGGGSSSRVRIGERWLTVVAEVPATPVQEKGALCFFDRSRQRYDDVEGSALAEHLVAEAQGRPCGDPAAKASDEPTPIYAVDVPDGACSAGAVVVYDALKEAASLGRVLDVVRRGRTGDDAEAQGAIQVFHLVSDTVTTLVETEAERRQVDRLLTEEGQLREELFLQDQRVPPGAVLVAGPPADDAGAALPRVLDFRLRVPALGFVVRLRQRFGCQVPEVFYGALRSLCEAARRDQGPAASEAGTAKTNAARWEES